MRLSSGMSPALSASLDASADAAAARDPWWIFTIINLFWNIKFRYDLGFVTIVKVSPRFGILLLCMTISLICIIVDLLSVTPVIPIGVINPFWKFAFVFKCFTDSIILDDFKAALDKLSRHRMSQILPFNVLGGPDSADDFRITNKKPEWPGHGADSFDSKSDTKVDAGARPRSIDLDDSSGISCPPPIMVHHIENKTG